jgi:tripartite-type tricarboxylate transporter receptor subunit TctC
MRGRGFAEEPKAGRSADALRSRAPKSTPAAVIDTLNSAIDAGLAEPQIKARIKARGGETMPMSPTEFDAFLTDDTAKWAKVLKFLGATAN